ncbi:hypothetical protein [Actinomycetospora cinnamomea]|uniref:hypothetical protein n=1 Tax=Actinomycetospora cinnamomea TaxID=663609 RepID=UPI0010582B61|nr:hypothetical protein [Actinomycetospora cinnamomea]
MSSTVLNRTPRQSLIFAPAVVTGRLFRGEAIAGIASYPARVTVDVLRVRPEASTRRPQVALLQHGTNVQVRCAVTVADDTWYELLEPHPRNFVSDIGLSFLDGSPPPRRAAKPGLSPGCVRHELLEDESRSPRALRKGKLTLLNAEPTSPRPPMILVLVIIAT